MPTFSTYEIYVKGGNNNNSGNSIRALIDIHQNN